MALLNFIIAGLTALLASFLSLSPIVFHGLAPWIERLSTSPMAPTPSAFTTVIFPREFWEEIPLANLSAVDFTPQPPTPAPSFFSDGESFVVPPPAPAFSFSVDDEEAFVVPLPESEEPTWEELFRLLGELWWLLKEALLSHMISNNQFILEHPWVAGFKPTCHLRRVYLLSRARLPGRSRGCLLSFSLIRRPRAVRTRAPASPVVPPASSLTPAPPPASPLAPISSVVPLASSPAWSPPAPPPAHPLAPPPGSPPTPFVERIRRATERRHEQIRIGELERAMEKITSQLEKMGRGDLVPAFPASAVAATHHPQRPQRPQSPPVSQGQPVVHTGSAPPPPHPRFGHHPPPPHHFGSAYHSPLTSHLYGPAYHPPPSQPFGTTFRPLPRAPNPHAGYGQPRPAQLSLEEFQRRYPLTGTKKAN